MRSPARVMVAAVLVLQLAACGGGSGDDDERTASGEVLEGSITDEMLPLDQVTSQPPLLKIEPTSKPSEGADAVEEDTDDAEAPGDAPPIATQTGSTE
jgi:hypothetical protein